MKEEQQKKFLELQILSQQSKELQQQYAVLDQQLIELSIIIDTLNEVKNRKDKTEILTSLGQGVFIKTNLKQNNEFLVNVGGNVVVAKSMNELLDLIIKQEDDIKSILEQIELEINQIYSRINQLNNDMIDLGETS